MDWDLILFTTATQINYLERLQNIPFVTEEGLSLSDKIYLASLLRECLHEKAEYIEMFYNSKRRHGSNGQRSPLDYEKTHQKMVRCV